MKNNKIVENKSETIPLNVDRFEKNKISFFLNVDEQILEASIKYDNVELLTIHITMKFLLDFLKNAS